jgi:hypothetical protein
LRRSPELKKSLDELKKSTSSLAEKCAPAAALCTARSARADTPGAPLAPRHCRAREGVAATAGAARDGLGAGARSASAAVRDSVGDTPAELLKAVRLALRSQA